MRVGQKKGNTGGEKRMLLEVLKNEGGGRAAGEPLA